MPEGSATCSRCLGCLLRHAIRVGHDAYTAFLVKTCAFRNVTCTPYFCISLSLPLKLCRLLLCFVYIPIEGGAGDPKPPADVLHRRCVLGVELFCQGDFLRRK